MNARQSAASAMTVVSIAVNLPAQIIEMDFTRSSITLAEYGENGKN
jgi:hypothetical protein